MRASRLATLFLAIAAASGCTVDLHHLSQGDDKSPSATDSSASPSVSDGYDQYAGYCPASSALYEGTHRTGEACNTAADCAPACCPCAGSPRSWLATSCLEGRCADPTTACQRTAYARPWCSVGVPLPPTPPTCGGLAYASASCDTCFHSECCAEGSACEADGSCDALRRCEGECADEACFDACVAAYPAGVGPLDRLDRCLESWCSLACN